MKEKKFFEFSGLKQETIRFKKLLDLSDTQKDHILIKGPRGSGKSSYFAQVFEEHTHTKPIRINCAAILPTLLESELFGHVKGAFTGATQDKKGFIEAADEAGQSLMLEEINSIDSAHQARLLVFMETGSYHKVSSTKPMDAKVRIIAAENYEKGTGTRDDLRDRFKIVIEAPPLYKRRGDILEYIGMGIPTP